MSTKVDKFNKITRKNLKSRKSQKNGIQIIKLLNFEIIAETPIEIEKIDLKKKFYLSKWQEVIKIEKISIKNVELKEQSNSGRSIEYKKINLKTDLK